MGLVRAIPIRAGVTWVSQDLKSVSWIRLPQDGMGSFASRLDVNRVQLSVRYLTMSNECAAATC